MANPRESELSYPMGEALPEPGGVLEVAPGLRWVRMGLPFALDHINLWLLRDEIDSPDGKVQGWSIVDCGICTDTTKALWEQVFEKHLDGLPVLRVIVTHFHPDHMGLAHWLTERWQVRLWMSCSDYNLARVASGSTVGMGGEAAAAFFASHGLTDEDSLAKIRARSSYYPSMVPAVPSAYRRLMEGQVLQIGGRSWRCIAGYGHAPEHISLYCEDFGGNSSSSGQALPVLISGDMLLPRISTNVSVVDVEPEADPLSLYLASTRRLLELAPETLVLPSHGRPFRGLPARVDQLLEHHQDRLAEVMAACQAKPCHAAELLEMMFKRKLDLHQTTFAMGEAVAHLNALWLQGRLQRECGDDGVYRFRT